jgi:hypothetical protein
VKAFQSLARFVLEYFRRIFEASSTIYSFVIRARKDRDCISSGYWAHT